MYFQSVTRSGKIYNALYYKKYSFVLRKSVVLKPLIPFVALSLFCEAKGLNAEIVEVSILQQFPKTQQKGAMFALSNSGERLNGTYSSEITEGVITEFTLYPNPASEKVMLEGKGLMKNTEFEILLVDMMGRIIGNWAKLADNPEWNEAFDVSTLSDGVYFYIIRQGEFEQKIKFVKQSGVNGN